MITDAHLHIGLNNWTEERLLHYLDEQGIEKAWILTWDELDPVAPPYYLPLDIEAVSQAFRRHPDRIVPFYAPDPGRKDWKARLQSRLDEGFAGCGELKVAYRWNDPRVTALLEFLDARRLPLVFHMEQGRRMFIPRRETGPDWLFKRLINERFNGKGARLIGNLEQKTGFLRAYLGSRMVDFPGYLMDFDLLREAVTNYPGVTFISHGPHTWNNFSVVNQPHRFIQKGKINGEGVLWDLLEKHGNFFCDISGFTAFTALNRDKEFTRTFMQRHHRKILFGTDNWELGLKDFLNGLSLEEEVMENIMHKNAARITSDYS